jgi:predicted 3-demethylubiquinone-9 3-methyltransferase (glyoxalase superfamily)
VVSDARIVSVSRYGDAGPGPKGAVMTVAFEIGGRPFVALNGGPQFKFTEAISFMIDCADQTEVDHYWDRLYDAGQPSQCGWLKDRFGLSWQVVPTVLPSLIGGSDPAGAQRAMAAMLQMGKLDIAALQKAYAG